MRRRIVGAIVLSTALAGSASAHGAGSVRECGGTLPAGSSQFIYDPPPGAASAYNVTTRSVGCPAARRFIVRGVRIRHAGGLYTSRGFTCRVSYDYELVDTSCTASGGRVIRWQAGS